MNDTATDGAAFAEAVVFLNYFEDLHDPRQPGKVTYPLDEILFLCLLAVLAGAEWFTEIALFGTKKLPLLRRFRPFKDGTPTHNHLGDILATLDAEQFQSCFIVWVAPVAGVPAGVIAIDGKTVRRSGQKGAKGVIHMISAFAARQRLVLGQVKVAEKSNEIVAIPELLDMLAIKGAIVTIDAMGCQRDIAQQVIDKKADYILALKGNQGALRDDVELFATEQKARRFADTEVSQDTTVDGDHGPVERRRSPGIETRTTTVIHDVKWLQDRHKWPGLNGVVIVESHREISGKIEQETRYYLTTLVMLTSLLGPVVRSHWAEVVKVPPAKPVEYGRRGSRTACTGSWTWCSATTNAGSGPITPQPTSQLSSTWRSICCDGRPVSNLCAGGARQRHGMMTSWPAWLPHESFARFP